MHQFVVRNDNEDRLKYLSDQIDEKTFKQKLYVKHCSSLRKEEERQIMETYVSIGEEIFRSLRRDNIKQIMEELERLVVITRSAITTLDSKYKYVGIIKPQHV
jgi:hypothetical protein